MKGQATKMPTKFRLYMNENNIWHKTIASQSKEIPTFRKMLNTAGDKRKLVEAGKLAVSDVFSKELQVQQQEMEQLRHAIDEQQKRLIHDCESEDENKYDIDKLCGQDILRDRIKAVEKRYIDLKCNFMNYIATLL